MKEKRGGEGGERERGSKKTTVRQRGRTTDEMKRGGKDGRRVGG